MTKRCAIYLRVSSEGQAEDDKYGLARQQANCEQYAAEQGWEVVGIYTEVMSGAKIWERATLGELRKQFATKAFDVLLVESLDRLSRDTYHQGMIFSEAERYDIEWDSATEEIKNSPEGKMIRTIIGLFAEVEREKINMRMYGGRIARMKSNKLPGMPMPTFGYNWGDDSKSYFVINPEEAAVVKLIYSLAESGMSEIKIAQRMNELGFTKAKGGKWSSSAIHKVLVNSTYIGEMYGRKYTHVKGENGRQKRILRPKEEWIPIYDAVPPIIDPIQFQRIQDMAGHKKAMSPRNSKNPHAHMLRGRIRCYQCGNLISAISASGKAPNYYRHQPEHASLSNCVKTGIPQATLDNAVWTQVTDVLMNPDTIRERLEEKRRKPHSNAGLIKSIESQLAKLSKQRDTSLQRFLLIEDETLATAANTLIQDLTKQIQSAEAELRELRAQDRSLAAEQRSIDELVENLHQFKDRLPLVTPAQRQNLMAALDVQIRLYPASRTPRWEGSFKLSPTAVDRLTLTSDIVLPSINIVEHKWAFLLTALAA